MSKTPNAVHEANMAGLATPAPRKPMAPDNRPSVAQIIAAYERAQAANDETALWALQDAYDDATRNDY